MSSNSNDSATNGDTLPQSEANANSLLERIATRFYSDYRMAILLVAVIVVAGLSSIAILPRMEDPVLVPRVAMISTRLPGADAVRVESLVTSKIEDTLRDIEQIKELRSTSRVGASAIVIELRDDVDESDSDAVWSRIRSRIEDVLPDLPPDASRPEFDELEVRAYALIFGLVWERTEPTDWRVLRRLAIELQDRLQIIPGTDSVDRFADPGEEIELSMDPATLASLGLTPRDISERLASHDAKRSAGLYRSSQFSLPIEVNNQFDQLDEIRAIPIREDASSFVRLGDVAQVRHGIPDPPSRMAKLAGQDAVVLACMVQSTYRIDHWTATAEQAIEQFKADLPAGIGIQTVLRQSDYVNERLGSLLSNLVLGAVAIAVVTIALMGWRSAILIVATLPLASLMVLFGLRIFGIPIHQMSITGLIIALGLLIDNAIVVVDEVHRRLLVGRTPVQALTESVRHLAIPLLGSTLTTAIAFAPIALMPGPAGEFVGSIAWSVIFAITASLFLSLTLLPAIAARALAGRTSHVAPADAAQAFDRPAVRAWKDIYHRWLMRLVGRPALGVGLVSIAPIVGFVLFTQLDEQFFPASGRNQFYVTLELSPTSSIEETVETSKAIDAIGRELGVSRIDWFYGESAPQFYYNIIANRRNEPSFAQGIITVVDEASTSDLIRRLQRACDKQILGARAIVRQLEQGPPFGAPIEVQLFGPDLEVLHELGDQVAELMSKDEAVIHCKTGLAEALPQLQLSVDAESARLAQLNPTTIAENLFTSLEGQVGGSILQDDQEISIVARFASQDRRRLDRISNIDLIIDRETTPQRIPLSAISELSLVSETALVPRLNRQRMNEVGVYVTAGVLPSVVQGEFQKRLAESDFRLPPGYRLAYGGEGAKRNEAVGNLFSTVGVLAVCMLTTLVLSFGSFRMAMMIGVVAVLSIGLGILSLWVGGYPFGFMAIIGTMGLIGVAINDSIVVLAAIQANPIARGGDLRAIVDEVYASTRHVLATTLTTVAGFGPLILSGGSFWPPMAICIAGGVIGATLLALVLVPGVYFLVTGNGRVARLSSDA